jgi:flagellar hook protein FlgE
MIRSLFAGVSGMKNHQVRMDVIGNNIANVNTTGYKSNRVNFQDMFYQMQRYASAPSGGASGAGSMNPAQIGSGVTVAGIGTNMGQGPLQSTGRTMDLGIQGNGFFQLKDDGGNLFYARNGIFSIDKNGSIVDSNGYFLTDDGGAEIQITGGNDQIGVIGIRKDGTLLALDTAGDDMGVTAKIGLYHFANQEGLAKAGENLFKETKLGGVSISGAATLIETVGETSTVNSGYLEMSNVDLTDEFTTMITTQRGYQANARTITTSDQMLQELLEIKR